MGVICRYPSMDLTDFNLNYFNKLLENISKEQRSIFLIRDFKNVNLLNYNEHNQTNELLESLALNSLIPLILQPIWITSHSNTLIDNIFSNVTDDLDNPKNQNFQKKNEKNTRRYYPFIRTCVP